MAAWAGLSQGGLAESLLENPRNRTVIVVLVAFIVILPVAFFFSWRKLHWTATQWLEEATTDARQWAPDAELVSIAGIAVNEKGVADLTGNGSWVFVFHSPSREQEARTHPDPEGVPGTPALPTSPSCRFELHVTHGYRGGYATETLQFRLSRGCGVSLPSGPRCSVDQVWHRAVVRGAPSHAYANIRLETTAGARQWLFEVPEHPGGASPVRAPLFKTSFPDDCN